MAYKDFIQNVKPQLTLKVHVPILSLDLIQYDRSETLPSKDNLWTPLHYTTVATKKKG